MEFTTQSCLFLAICLAATAAGIVLGARTSRAVDFHFRVYRLGMAYKARHPGSMFGEWFARKHPLRRLLFSFRPLDLGKWYSDEEIREIHR